MIFDKIFIIFKIIIIINFGFSKEKLEIHYEHPICTLFLLNLTINCIFSTNLVIIIYILHFFKYYLKYCLHIAPHFQKTIFSLLLIHLFLMIFTKIQHFLKFLLDNLKNYFVIACLKIFKLFIKKIIPNSIILMYCYLHYNFNLGFKFLIKINVLLRK